MSSINVKIPEPLKDEIDDFIKDHPYYLSKSELVRDAIRHLIHEEHRLSGETLRVIAEGKEQMKRGEGKTLTEVRKELDG
ncbi:MAG: ribbon-helix-helix domain-containing protein [Euryarchaeota archaeon]|nr:ribbon-helix-helix domain-containing protein [Euryarchaeota archaeon]